MDIQERKISSVYAVHSVVHRGKEESGLGDLLYAEETYRIRGAAFEVYKEMGHGYVEPVYQECLEREFSMQDLPFTAQQDVTLCYKGKALHQFYRPDFLCYDRILVELKAVKTLAPEHRAQVMNYLKATELRLGLLINFGHYPGVEIERIIR